MAWQASNQKDEPQDIVEILDFPHPKTLPHKEGGALTAHYGSESSPSLILGVRGRGMGVFFNRVRRLVLLIEPLLCAAD